jgi:hypothetical protein
MKINGMMNGSAVPLGLIQNPKVSCFSDSVNYLFIIIIIFTTVNIFASWALFFSKFITAYQKVGLKFWGLTIQNVCS